ncbi:glycine cleavage system protein R [Neptunicella marina]|uniref:Glycine cleavage system transcriptional repressor n=1 Tax=Neptunicella marina TaxID=2125989 RepID=A0A8J6LXH9_9ALTE|nr:ACT domain-containing protein [Neptunicella marina]MBC3764810.1 glycine cleavage system protein R [Neptunicella marina]
MKQIVVTLVGSDKPGIVDRISKTIYQHQGNWLASNLSKMAGQFAGIIQVMLPEEKIEQFEVAVNQISDLRCVVHADTETDTSAELRTAYIELVGNDKPGIVQEITSAIHQAGANVVKMHTLCESAPNWGGELFKAEIVIAFPLDLNAEKIQQELEAVADDLVVELTVKPA